LFLLQLVQALKYEKIGEKNVESSLGKFLIERSIANPVLGNYFYWYLVVEIEDKRWEGVYQKMLYHFMKELVRTCVSFLFCYYYLS